jgi:hypothetical protein
MIKIYNKGTGEFLGRIAETDLEFLVDELEEESLEDRDYYIRKDTFDKFASQGASAHLMEVLGAAFRGTEMAEIRWEKE